MKEVYIICVKQYRCTDVYEERISSVFDDLELAENHIPKVMERIISGFFTPLEELDFRWTIRYPRRENNCLKMWTLDCKFKEEDNFRPQEDEIYIYKFEVTNPSINIKSFSSNK